MTLRVLHTEWSSGWGGQEIRILEEMKAFREQGIIMAIACRQGAEIAKKAHAEKFTVHYLPFSHRLDVHTVFGLARLAREQGYQLFHAHSSVDGWLSGLAGKVCGIPVVRSRHLSALVPPGINARVVYDWLADAVIASGEFIREHLITTCGCKPEKIFSIPAGADPHRFSPDIDSRGVKKEFGLEQAWPIVGIVAVLRSWKGHKILFQACAQLLPDFPNLHIFVVGDGPLRDHLPRWAEELGLGNRVVFAGFREDVAACMKAMDVCVLPSLKNEATSQVMPQAMLVGTPVISSSAGGLVEVVKDGITGRVVPPGDAQALAYAMRCTVSEKEVTRHMAANARRYALEHLTFKGQVDKTLRVYEYVLSRRHVKIG